MTTHNDELKPTREQLLAFLSGKAPIFGLWFGERREGELGIYWWRKYLPILAEQPQPAPVQVDSLPPLPALLLRMLGEYGHARSDGASEAGVIEKYEIVIRLIKRYALEPPLPAEPSMRCRMGGSWCRLIRLWVCGEQA